MLQVRMFFDGGAYDFDTNLNASVYINDEEYIQVEVARLLGHKNFMIFIDKKKVNIIKVEVVDL